MVNPPSVMDLYIFSILIAILGVVVIIAIIMFGHRILARSEQNTLSPELLNRAFDFWENANIKPNLPRYLSDSYAEHLQRRNEFWTAYGQVILAVLIIVVLSILLITRTISAEAGLPILSAITGFAIAKGVDAKKTVTSPEREQQ